MYATELTFNDKSKHSQNIGHETVYVMREKIVEASFIKNVAIKNCKVHI